MLLGLLSSCLKGVLLSIQYVICAGSICKMKQNHHFMVPEADFQLLQGEDKLTLYQVCKSDIWQAASYRHCDIHSGLAGACSVLFGRADWICKMFSVRLDRKVLPGC